MVSANDNHRRAGAPVNVHVNGTPDAARLPLTRSVGQNPAQQTRLRVTDDMAPMIAVQIGEARLLGRLLDAVTDQLRARAANDR